MTGVENRRTRAKAPGEPETADLVPVHERVVTAALCTVF
jgi:hypothetical protein